MAHQAQGPIDIVTRGRQAFPQGGRVALLANTGSPMGKS